MAPEFSQAKIGRLVALADALFKWKDKRPAAFEKNVPLRIQNLLHEMQQLAEEGPCPR
jgi:hypothetical protein